MHHNGCHCAADKINAYYEERIKHMQQEILRLKQLIAHQEGKSSNFKGMISALQSLISDIFIVGSAYQLEFTNVLLMGGE